MKIKNENTLYIQLLDIYMIRKTFATVSDNTKNVLKTITRISETNMEEFVEINDEESINCIDALDFIIDIGYLSTLSDEELNKEIDNVSKRKADMAQSYNHLELYKQEAFTSFSSRMKQQYYKQEQLLKFAKIKHNNELPLEYNFNVPEKVRKRVSKG